MVEGLGFRVLGLVFKNQTLSLNPALDPRSFHPSLLCFQHCILKLCLCFRYSSGYRYGGHLGFSMYDGDCCATMQMDNKGSENKTCYEVRALF